MQGLYVQRMFLLGSCHEYVSRQWDVGGQGLAVPVLRQGVQPNDADVFYLWWPNKSGSANDGDKCAIGLRVLFWVRDYGGWVLVQLPKRPNF